MVEAMIRRKKTFLEQKTWMVTPWLKHPETRTMKQQVVDVLVFVPGLSEDVYDCLSAKSSGKDKTERIREVESRTIGLLQKLVNWRWKWETDNPFAVEERKITPENLSNDEEGAPLFDTIFWYQNIEKAMEISLYNVAMAVLIYMGRTLGITNTVQKALEGMVQGPPTNRGILMMPTPEMDGSTDAITMEICRSIEYMIQDEQASIGSWSIMLPLRLVYVSRSSCLSMNTHFL